jgi:exosortase K
MHKNLFYYAFGILIFLGLKFSYTQMDANGLLFLIAPTDWFVSLMVGEKGYYVDSIGYFHKDLNIVVEKSCSGFNFLILSFITCYFLCIQFVNKTWLKWMLLPFSFLLGYILTIFVNTSRICTAILVQQSTSTPKIGGWFHEAQGTFIYLFFLLSFYKTAHYFLTKYSKKNEKFA